MAGDLSPAIFLLCQIAAVDARNSAQDLPHRKGIYTFCKEGFANALRLRAIKPAAEKTKVIGNGLGIYFGFGRWRDQVGQYPLQTLFQNISRNGLYCRGSALRCEWNGFYCRRVNIKRA